MTCHLKKAGTGLVAALAVTLLPAWSTAAPPIAGDVPQDAKWVLHFDFDAARQTRLSEAIRDREALDEQLGRGYDWLEQRYGIAREDLHGLTAYGTNYDEHRGVALLRADYEPKKLERILQDQPQYETSQHEGHTLHTWSARDDFSQEGDLQDVGTETEAEAANENGDEPAGERQDDLQVDVGLGEDDHRHRVTAVLLDDVVLIGASQEIVANAVDRLPFETNASAQSEILGASIPDGTVFFGTAVDLAGLRDRAELALLGDVRQWTVAAGEDGDELFWTCRITTTEEDLAENLRDVVEGFTAFAALAVEEARAQGQPNVPDEETLELLSLDVEQDDEVLTVEWDGDVDEVVEGLEKLPGGLLGFLRLQMQAREDVEVNEPMVDEEPVEVEAPEAAKDVEPRE